MGAEEYLELRAAGQRPILYAGDWSILAGELADEIDRLRAANAALLEACGALKGQLDRYFARLATEGCEPWIDPGVVGGFEAAIVQARAAGEKGDG